MFIGVFSAPLCYEGGCYICLCEGGCVVGVTVESCWYPGEDGYASD